MNQSFIGKFLFGQTVLGVALRVAQGTDMCYVLQHGKKGATEIHVDSRKKTVYAMKPGKI